MQFQLDVCGKLFDDFLYGRVRDQYERGCGADVVFTFLGCGERSRHRRPQRQDPFQVGPLPALAADRGPAHRGGAGALLLGPPAMVPHGQDRLYGGDLLRSGAGLHLCEHPLRHPVRGHDPEYRGAGEDQHLPLGQRHGGHRHYQYHNRSANRVPGTGG